jgi:hypothetical protein
MYPTGECTMATQISYKHFCNLGALCNPNCFTSWDDKAKVTRYYYHGVLSEACWMGWNKTSPRGE